MHRLATRLRERRRSGSRFQHRYVPDRPHALLAACPTPDALLVWRAGARQRAYGAPGVTSLAEARLPDIAYGVVLVRRDLVMVAFLADGNPRRECGVRCGGRSAGLGRDDVAQAAPGDRA